MQFICESKPGEGVELQLPGEAYKLFIEAIIFRVRKGVLCLCSILASRGRSRIECHPFDGLLPRATITDRLYR